MLDKKLILVVYANDFISFEKKKKSLLPFTLTSEQIVFCDSSQKNRIECVEEHKEHWLLFLDYDCEPTAQTFNRIQYHMKESLPDLCVMTGLYENPNKPSYLQKTHNFIANTWVREAKGKAFLGGLFLVKPHDVNLIDPDHKPPLFWGAEDLWLAEILLQKGFQINLDSNFKVIHHTTSSWAHFKRRAWLQGINFEKYIANKKENSKVRYFFWFGQTLSAGLFLVPAILLHFCIQKAAILFQKTHPASKLK